MKHVVLGFGEWGWDAVSRKFTFKIELGEHLKSAATVVVPDGIELVNGATVWAGGRGNVLIYSGQDLVAAKGHREIRDPNMPRTIQKWLGLPDNSFTVTAEGEIVVGGDVNTQKDLLLFLGHCSIRGDVIVGEETTAEIIRRAYAGRQERILGLTAVIKLGQQLVVYVTGRSAESGRHAYKNVDGEIQKIVDLE